LVEKFEKINKNLEKNGFKGGVLLALLPPATRSLERAARGLQRQQKNILYEKILKIGWKI
jgi:hypothetical protein